MPRVLRMLPTSNSQSPTPKGVVFLHASTAAAHHSFAAEYDVEAIGASHGG